MKQWSTVCYSESKWWIQSQSSMYICIRYFFSHLWVIIVQCQFRIGWTKSRLAHNVACKGRLVSIFSLRPGKNAVDAQLGRFILILNASLSQINICTCSDHQQHSFSIWWTISTGDREHVQYVLSLLRTLLPEQMPDCTRSSLWGARLKI